MKRVGIFHNDSPDKLLRQPLRMLLWIASSKGRKSGVNHLGMAMHLPVAVSTRMKYMRYSDYDFVSGE